MQIDCKESKCKLTEKLNPAVLERCCERVHALGRVFVKVDTSEEVTLIRRGPKWITVERKDGRKAGVPTDSKQSRWRTLDNIDAKVVDRAFLFEPSLWPLSELDLQDQYV